MGNYRVTVQTQKTKLVKAENAFMAAVKAAGAGETVVDVTSARIASNGAVKKKVTKRTTKKRVISEEMRAKLAENAAKARAAKAKKARAAKK